MSNYLVKVREAIRLNLRQAIIVSCLLFYIYGDGGSTSTLMKETNPFISMPRKAIETVNTGWM
jgi:hypothetical protein